MQLACGCDSQVTSKWLDRAMDENIRPLKKILPNG
jgi:hypothetical protein